MPKNTKPIYPDHDDLVCAACGKVEVRNALPGQVLQPTPGWVCEDCQHERNLPVYKQELEEKPEGFTTAREAYLKVQVKAAEARIAAKEAKAEADAKAEAEDAEE
jgi:hypothetical protein